MQQINLYWVVYETLIKTTRSLAGRPPMSQNWPLITAIIIVRQFYKSYHQTFNSLSYLKVIYFRFAYEIIRQ